MQQEIILTTDIEKSLSDYLHKQNYDGLYILTDTNTEKYCYKRIQGIPELKMSKRFTIPAGDDNKTLFTIEKVWEFLSKNDARRKSLLIDRKSVV